MLKKVKKHKGQPIVYRDGKKVDMSSVNSQWVDKDVLKEGMKYISKMTEGLATGTMSVDEEYIELKNKVIKEMIDDRATKLTKELCVEAEKKSGIYDHAEMIQDETLKSFQDYAKQVAEDSTVEIYYDELTGGYKINRNPRPFSLKCNSTFSNPYKGKWHTIDAKSLKEEIKKRGEGIGETNSKSALDESKLLKEVEEKLKAQKLNKKSAKLAKIVVKTAKKKKPAKKTIKKKVAKKKVKKAKKRDRK